MGRGGKTRGESQEDGREEVQSGMSPHCTPLTSSSTHQIIEVVTPHTNKGSAITLLLLVYRVALG